MNTRIIRLYEKVVKLTVETRVTRVDSIITADTLNGPGPSNTAWALKWAGPKKNLGLIGGLGLVDYGPLFVG